MAVRPILSSLLATLILLSASVTALLPDTEQAAPAAPLADRLAEAWGITGATPADDPRDLVALVQAFDKELGVVRAPIAYAPLAHLDPALAAPLADLLAALLQAHTIRNDAYVGIDDATLLAMLDAEDPAALHILDSVDATALRTATVAIAATVDRVLPTLQQRADTLTPLHLPTAGPTIDLAPVLVLDPLGLDDLYEKDAVLMVDLGGNDVYDANAGGSMIHQGLVGDPGTCQEQVSNFYVGCENEDSVMSFTASLLIDVAGDDTYGVYKEPRAGSRDPRCTSDPIIRRVVTYGSGSGGIGMLVDATGNDQYRGKTLSMGNGHLAGVGAFFDLSGDDDYRAVRSAMGSGVLAGSGFFLDGGGNDAYTFEAPTGGLFNADSGRCDTAGRLGLGAAVIQSHGAFFELGGTDTYRVQSQAFGHVESQGAAQFFDLGGTDDYGGYAGRGNDQTVTGAGVFVDTGVTA